jgi:DNA mismatch repair protein MutL
MTGRYSVAFLFVEMPPDQVDVNVHPTKAEVRLRNKDQLYQIIRQAVSQQLQAADLTAWPAEAIAKTEKGHAEAA